MDARIHRLVVTACRIPTEMPESDGTLAWDATTMVLVELSCGLAGSFGFEKDHYETSIACGERVLLPAVRNAADDELIITDGFSCQEQIEQQTGRRAVHLAQVLQMALREGHDAPHPGPPQREQHREHARKRLSGAWLAAAATLVGGLAVWTLLKRHGRTRG